MLLSRKNLLSRVSEIAGITAGFWLFAHDVADRLIHATIDAVASKEKHGMLESIVLKADETSQALRHMISSVGIATREDINEVDVILERIINLLQD